MVRPVAFEVILQLRDVSGVRGIDQDLLQTCSGLLQSCFLVR